MKKERFHLHALELRRSHEAARLNQTTNPNERALRMTWLAQIDKEIAAERLHLGLVDEAAPDMSDEELLRELGA